MVKEKESQRYLQDKLASFVDPLSLAIAFFEVFDKNGKPVISEGYDIYIGGQQPDTRTQS